MTRKQRAALLLVPAMALTLIGATACTATNVYVVDVQQTAGVDSDLITIYYSDGTTATFSITHGKDGADGEDGKDVSALDLYNTYLQQNDLSSAEYTYTQFLDDYLDITSTSESDRMVADSLNSVVKIYSEWVTNNNNGFITTTDATVAAGSGVIYKMDESENGYTYIITNYHVVNNSEAVPSKNGGSTIARKICTYLYGSEDFVTKEGVSSDGYTKYNYGKHAVPCEFVGGSASSDIALIRARTKDLKAHNPDIHPITFAQGYTVGQTAIAIGNPESDGISVTRGIVSVDSEQIALSGVDGTARSYRVMRIDTAIYQGSSGGGLFNLDGELIGITNAGSSTDADQNINYALPVGAVKAIADGIYYYCANNTLETYSYKLTLGITSNIASSKYVFDEQTGTGKIVEEIIAASVSYSAPAYEMGLRSGDRLLACTINGTRHSLARDFELRELLLTVREGDSITIDYKRNGENHTSSAYTVRKSDLNKVI